jgi:hypothetical protein
VQIRRLVPALAVAVLVLTGCSGGSSSSGEGGSSSSSSSSAATMSASDFMAGFCTALTDWSSAIQARQGTFTPDTNDLESLKQNWLDFLDGVNEDTDTMLERLHGLGTPDVADGEETAATVIEALTTLGTSFKDLRDQSAQLPTTSPAAFTQQFQTLLTTFQSDVGSFGTSFEQLHGDELESAFSSSPECGPLR